MTSNFIICPPCKYYQDGSSRIEGWTRHVALNWKRRGAYRVLAGKPDVKRQLGRSRRVWEDYINIYVKEINSESLNWIGEAQNRDQ
jgi:hypothetical protein